MSNSPKAGRPRALEDPLVRSRIVSLIIGGLSRRTACGYAGVHYNTLARELDRDAEFLAEVQHAEAAHEFHLVHRISEAGRKKRYWRAAAWKLERKYPQRYRPRPADSLSLDEFRLFVKYLSRVVASALPNEADRRLVRRRLRRIPDLVRRKTRRRRVRRELRDLALLEGPAGAAAGGESRPATAQRGDENMAVNENS